jgi:anthranilate phosphoribosyltransferase
MKFAAPARAELGFRTIFNLLGPLTNPAGATRQVLGVYEESLTEPIARVLGRLGSQAAMVVHGRMSWAGGPAPAGVGLCELATTGPTRISRLQQGAVVTQEFDARTLGLRPVEPSALAAEGPAASARMVRDVLDGAVGAGRDMVILNAAAALVVADLAADLRAGLGLAEQAIDSGAARAVLAELIKITREDQGR